MRVLAYFPARYRESSKVATQPGKIDHQQGHRHAGKPGFRKSQKEKIGQIFLQ